MYLRLLPFTFALWLLVAACTPMDQAEKPKVLCPVCGTELDAVFHKHF